MREFAPDRRGAGRRVAVVVSRFHETITRALLDACVATLRENGVAEGAITVAWVPGSFELPSAAARLARAGGCDAIVALGCVIRGETPHFEHVAGEAARGLADVGRTTGVPTIFGVVTAENYDQAVARAGGTHGNRGADAALSALEMANLFRRIGG